MANIVNTRSTGLSGLWVSQARTQSLLSGATPANGGMDSHWYAGELLLAALNTCATSLLYAAAQERGLTLDSVHVHADSERAAAYPDQYSRLHLHFSLVGVTETQARELVEHFQANCPIYGTISRGAPATVSVSSQGSYVAA